MLIYNATIQKIDKLIYKEDFVLPNGTHFNMYNLTSDCRYKFKVLRKEYLATIVKLKKMFPKEKIQTISSKIHSLKYQKNYP